MLNSKTTEGQASKVAGKQVRIVSSCGGQTWLPARRALLAHKLLPKKQVIIGIVIAILVILC